MGEEAAVGVADGGDLLDPHDLRRILKQRSDVRGVVHAAVLGRAAPGRRVPEARTVGVFQSLWKQQRQIVAIAQRGQPQVLVVLPGVAPVCVKADQ